MGHIGNCFCGAVKIEVTGSPEAMGYCHCNSCRSWSGGPVNAFSLWKSDAVRITAGETARLKRFEIEGVDDADLAAAFGAPPA